ncbi:MAG: hypothetical protein PVH25_14135 [Burkholderiales bacterium]|jgi:hypothetical protein
MPSSDATLGASPVLTNAFHPRTWRLAIIVCAILALNLTGGWLASQLNLQIWPQHSDIIEMIIVAIVIGYILAMAFPFVPGIEIGLALMLLLGPGGIALVYLCTQLALALSFLLGRLVPTRIIAGAFGWLKLDKARRLVEELENTPPRQRIRKLAERSPSPWVAFLVRHRYLALAAILNLPGNAIIGGAGGIGMIAGMSRACPFHHFVALMAVSTLPVPLFLILTGL